MSRSSKNSFLSKPSGKLAAILVVSLTFGAGYALTRKRDSQNARLGVVKKGDLAQRVTIAGKIVSRRTSTVAPPYNGYIKKIYVKIGQKVKEDAPLVSITQSTSGAGEEVFPIRAPFDGTIVSVSKTEGEYVEMTKQDNQILRIDDLTGLLVQGDVPEIDVPKVRPGQEVVIRPAPLPGNTYKGLIREVSIASKATNTGTFRPDDRVDYPIRIEVIDPNPALQPGMSVSVDVISEKRTGVLIVGHEYIEKSGDGFQVTTAEGEKKSVELGLQTDEAFEITQGVKEGDELKPVDFFRDMK